MHDSLSARMRIRFTLHCPNHLRDVSVFIRVGLSTIAIISFLKTLSRTTAFYEIQTSSLNFTAGGIMSTGRLPNLLLAGAQKGGTSSLALMLFESDAICQPHSFDYEPDFFSKEIHIFDQRERYSKGAGFYRQRFAHCMSPHYKYALDATPDYMLFPEQIYNLYSENNEIDTGDSKQPIKIIFSLREPIAREVSWYNHQVRIVDEVEWAKRYVYNYKTKQTLSFAEYFERILKRKFEKQEGKESKSFYAKYLKKWFKLFDRENILILSFQEIQENPSRVVRRLEEFLNISLPSQALPNINTSNLTKTAEIESCPDQESLLPYFDDPNKDLYALVAQYPGPSMEEKPFPKFNFKCSLASK